MEGDNIELVSKIVADFRELQSESMKEMQAFMVESMKSAMVDFSSTMVNVIRQQFSQTSAPKGRDELAEPSKKNVIYPQAVLVKGGPWIGEDKLRVRYPSVTKEWLMTV